MEIVVKARKIGGSMGVLLPKQIVLEEKIGVDDILTITVEKKGDLGFLWGICKDSKTPTQEIMNEIDTGEDE